MRGSTSACASIGPPENVCALLTITSYTPPEFGGVFTTNSSFVYDCTDALFPPNNTTGGAAGHGVHAGFITRAAGMNGARFFPRIVTVVPPCSGPERGEIDSTTGRSCAKTAADRRMIAALMTPFLIGATPSRYLFLISIALNNIYAATGKSRMADDGWQVADGRGGWQMAALRADGGFADGHTHPTLLPSAICDPPSAIRHPPSFPPSAQPPLRAAR